MTIIVPICLKLLVQEICFATPFALPRAGNNIAAKIAMIAITTKSSMSVKVKELQLICLFLMMPSLPVFLMMPSLSVILPPIITREAGLSNNYCVNSYNYCVNIVFICQRLRLMRIVANLAREQTIKMALGGSNLSSSSWFPFIKIFCESKTLDMKWSFLRIRCFNSCSVSQIILKTNIRYLRQRLQSRVRRAELRVHYSPADEFPSPLAA